MSEDKESKLKEYRKKIIDAIGQEQLGESPKDETEIDELAQDVSRDSMTEEHGESIAPLEKAGSEEIDDSLVDDRFSKSHEVDESMLRQKRKMQIQQDVDKPADSGSK
jgi:hypothetical protein